MKKVFDDQAFLKETQLMAQLIVRHRQAMNHAPVHSQVKPGFFRNSQEQSPPQTGQNFQTILQTVEKQLFPGLTHWQSLKFFAYFPSLISHVSILADMWASAFHSPGFTYSSSPTHSEVESLIIDWSSAALGLPQGFSFKKLGGGCIPASASEGSLLSVHLGVFLKKQKGIKLSKLVGYYSDFSHISIKKALYLKELQNIRIVPCSFDKSLKNFVTDYTKLEQMIKEDLEQGLTPCWYGATLGSTPTGAKDDLLILGAICKKYEIFLSVDAAYIGSSFIIPELRVVGLEQADLILVNFSKAMMVGNVGTMLFVKDRKHVNASHDFGRYAILGQEHDDELAVNFKDWSISLGRRLNALKSYFVFRYFGVQGIQALFQRKIKVLQHFIGAITKKGQFQIFTAPVFGLVTFKAVAPFGQSQLINRKVADEANKDTSKGYMTPSIQNGEYFLRMVVAHPETDQLMVEQFAEYLHECLARAIKDE